MRVLLLAAACAGAAACTTEYKPVCALEDAPSIAGIAFTHCSVKFDDSYREGLGGRYWLILLGRNGGALDLFLPLDAVPNGAVRMVSSGTRGSAEDTGSALANENVNSLEPGIGTKDDSGTVQVRTTGTMPTDTRDGAGTIEVVFDPPLTLYKGDRTYMASGTLRVSLSAEPVDAPGGGCGACVPKADAATAACNTEALSFECYCASAKMHQCTIDTGCTTDPETSRQNVAEMKDAADNISSTGARCTP